MQGSDERILAPELFFIEGNLEGKEAAIYAHSSG